MTFSRNSNLRLKYIRNFVSENTTTPSITSTHSTLSIPIIPSISIVPIIPSISIVPIIPSIPSTPSIPITPIIPIIPILYRAMLVTFPRCHTERSECIPVDDNRQNYCHADRDTLLPTVVGMTRGDGCRYDTRRRPFSGSSRHRRSLTADCITPYTCSTSCVSTMPSPFTSNVERLPWFVCIYP